jgi:MFS transporter, OFA family, oxalate/formate antiporter
MRRTIALLCATMLITFVLGSVHAFSVFIVPLESILQLPRSEISLIYSLALVSITLSVLLGYRIYTRLASWWMILLVCLCAAIGLRVAADASSWWQLLLGYSFLFGLANGVGYGYCLQLAGLEMPERKGFAMGAVTAAYAVGSIVFAQIFAQLIETNSIAIALHSLSIIIIISGLISALLLYGLKARYQADNADSQNTPFVNTKKHSLLIFWFAYMTSVFAGLMAIGHAAGIALAKGSSLEWSSMGATMIGVGSALGGFLAGWMIDRWSARHFLIGLPLLTAIALVAVSFSSNVSLVIALLTIVGFSYGAIIAIYPVVISDIFKEQGAWAYGRIFIAWGFSGLVAPWFAGLIFDWQTNYSLALWLAAFIALTSAFLVKIFGAWMSPEDPTCPDG